MLALALPSIASAAGLMPVYRFFNLKTGTHFYTASEVERADVQARLSATYRFEGVAYTIDTDNPLNSAPLYRFYNFKKGTHFYTASAVERDFVTANLAFTFRPEGIAYNVSLTSVGTTPVYRFYNVRKGAHFYTASEIEKNSVIANLSAIYTFEGAKFWFAGPVPLPPAVEMPWHQSDLRFCTQVGCHFVSLTVEHNRYPQFQAVGTRCKVCHSSTNPQVMNAILAGSDACIDCHFYTTGAIDSYPHPGTSLAHGLPTLTCTAFSGCHGVGDLATIHEGPPAKTATTSGCRVCHANGAIPSNNCITCHGDKGPHGTHQVIPSTSVGDQTCTLAACHGTDLVTAKVHKTCAACHAPTANPFVDPLLTDNVVDGAAATCEACHVSYDAAHAPAGTVHVIGGSCFISTCHNRTDVGLVHSTGDDPPGCGVCHNPGPATTIQCGTCHPNLDSFHNFTHVDASGGAGQKSSACTSCHGTDIPTVHANRGCFCHFTAFLRPEMTPLLLAGTAECVDCHKDMFAPHGFNGTGVPGSKSLASGHNTETFGQIGGLTKWDGSELGVVIKDSTDTTITQEWPLPTASVFWSQSKALNLDGTVNTGGVYSLNPTDSPTVAMAGRGGVNMSSKINTTVGWNSVITCQDCHTNLDLSMGPQGANAGDVGLDPNFPDDWTRAEITSFDPTGMRSIETTRGSGNPYYPELGSNVYMPPEVINGTLAGSSVETTVKPVYGAGMPDQTTTKTVYPGGFYAETNQTGTGYSSADKTGRFICQKCHKLTNSFQGLAIEGNGRGFRDNNYNYMGMSNEAHMEHHNDLTTGQGNCVSCHIAIPHGWKRPRLLVYESDPAPYKVQYIWPNYRTTDLSLLSTSTPDLSQGNWGWLNKAPNGNALTLSSRYQDVTATNVYTGALNSTHLERLTASPTALKELEIGVPPLDYAGYDAQNGTSWGKWLHSAQGVIWPGDPSPTAAHINLTVWDATLNTSVVIAGGEAPIQNNCTACTSASSGTHAPQVGPGGAPVALTNEGVNSTEPYWK